MGQGVFLSTFEKQLDGKRRLLIPQEFRTADNGAEHGVFCFFSITADCLEAGGDKLMAEYVARIEALPFGSDKRTALEEATMRLMGAVAHVDPEPCMSQASWAITPPPFPASRPRRTSRGRWRRSAMPWANWPTESPPCCNDSRFFRNA